MSTQLTPSQVEEILQRNIFALVIEDGQTHEYTKSMWSVWWGLMDTNIKEGLIAAMIEVSVARNAALENEADRLKNKLVDNYKEQDRLKTLDWSVRAKEVVAERDRLTAVLKDAKVHLDGLIKCAKATNNIPLLVAVVPAENFLKTLPSNQL